MGEKSECGRTNLCREHERVLRGRPAFDRAYYRRNVELGNSPGQSRLRYRYGNLVSPWFPWLFVSRSEMRVILRGTGWHQARVLGSRPSEPYVAILERD